MRAFVKRNALSVAIFLFLVLFGGINYMKPSVMYNEHGELRQFGMGYSHKTIIPVWLFAIILGILCYLAVKIFIEHA
jgi:hypothetical protein